MANKKMADKVTAEGLSSLRNSQTCLSGNSLTSCTWINFRRCCVHDIAESPWKGSQPGAIHEGIGDLPSRAFRVPLKHT